MIRRPPRSTPLYSSAASDVYKRQRMASRMEARAPSKDAARWTPNVAESPCVPPWVTSCQIIILNFLASCRRLSGSSSLMFSTASQRCPRCQSSSPGRSPGYFLRRLDRGQRVLLWQEHGRRLRGGIHPGRRARELRRGLPYFLGQGRRPISTQAEVGGGVGQGPVSYTHLTLATNREV